MASELEVGKVKASDSIGIGVSGNPSDPLHIDGDGTADILLTRTNEASSGTLGRIFFGANDGDQYLVSVEGYQDGATDAGGLIFSTEATGGNRANRLTIDSTGTATFEKSDGAIVNLKRNDGTTGDGDEFGKIAAVSADDNHTGGTDAGSIKFVAHGNQTGTKPRTKLLVRLPNDSNEATALMIDATKLATFYGGIAFKSAATGSGVSSTDLTLDDYEEGSFTATLRGATEPSTLITTTACRYTRIGDRVHFSIGFENKNTTGYAGAISVDGLPFANNATIRSVVNVLPYNLGSWASGQATAVIYFSSTTISLYSIASASAWSTISHNAGTARYLWINGSYKV